jgi:small conductance mechanosensitive channel
MRRTFRVGRSWRCSMVRSFGIKILAAIAFWVIGRWLIGTVGHLVQSALERQKVDATIMRYLGTVINVTLNILLVVGILGYFGIQTTTFAALFAAAGVAIGLAWSGFSPILPAASS